MLERFDKTAFFRTAFAKTAFAIETIPHTFKKTMSKMVTVSYDGKRTKGAPYYSIYLTELTIYPSFGVEVVDFIFLDSGPDPALQNRLVFCFTTFCKAARISRVAKSQFGLLQFI